MIAPLHFSWLDLQNKTYDVYILKYFFMYWQLILNGSSYLYVKYVANYV